MIVARAVAVSVVDKQGRNMIMMDIREDRHAFVNGYIEAMLWVNTFDADRSEDAADNTPEEPVSELRDMLTWDAVKALVRDALDFFKAQREDLTSAAVLRPWDHLGEDFALSRAGHGTGFWDRGLGDLGDRLHKAAKVYGDSGLYLTQGAIYAD